MAWIADKLINFQFALPRKKMQWLVPYKTPFATICVLAIEISTWETHEESKLCFYLGLRERLIFTSIMKPVLIHTLLV